MAEENKQEDNQTDAGNTGDGDNTNNADSQTQTDKSSTETNVNWEQRYKDLQTKETQSSQENAGLRRQIEESQPIEEEEEELSVDEDGFVDGKTVKGIVDKAVAKAIGQVRNQSANAYFRRTYKDLVKYESAIAGIMRNPKDPGKLKGVPAEERIDAAVEEFNALTEEAKAGAVAEAETAMKAKVSVC